MKTKLTLAAWITGLLLVLFLWIYSHNNMCIHNAVIKDTFFTDSALDQGQFHSYFFWYPDVNPAGVTASEIEVRNDPSRWRSVSHTLFREAPSFRYEKVGDERSVEYSLPLWLVFLVFLGGSGLSFLRIFLAKRRHNKSSSPTPDMPRVETTLHVPEANSEATGTPCQA